MHTKDELELFLGDPMLAENAVFLETLGSWLAIKILHTLSSSDKPMSTADLARQSHVDIKNVKEVLDGLSARGLLISEISKDGTKMWRFKEPLNISITVDKAGLNVERGVRSIHEEKKQEIKADIDLISSIDKKIVETTHLLQHELVKYQRRQIYLLVGIGITGAFAVASVILQFIRFG